MPNILRMNLNTWVSFGLEEIFACFGLAGCAEEHRPSEARGPEQEQSLADRQVAGPKDEPKACLAFEEAFGFDVRPHTDVGADKT
jgi:hypothetical protein